MLWHYIGHYLFYNAFGHLDGPAKRTVNQAEWQNNRQKKYPLKNHIQADVSHQIKWVLTG